MIDVRVLDVRPHPDQATNNPGSWAVKLRVSYLGQSRTFWRWHTVREKSEKKPSAATVVEEFWDDTFRNLHGFDFEREP